MPLKDGRETGPAPPVLPSSPDLEVPLAVSVSWLTGEIRRRLLLGLPLPTAAIGVVLFNLLKRPVGLVSAKDEEAARKILELWANEGLIGSIRASLYVDVVCMALGSLWLALLCLWVADQRSGRLRWAGWIFAAVSLLAGVMSGAENLMLARQLAGELTSATMYGADIAGVVKDLALGLTGLFALGGCFMLAVLPARPPEKQAAPGQLTRDPLGEAPPIAEPVARPTAERAPAE